MATIEKQVIREAASRDMSAEEDRRFTNVQIPYKNLADHPVLADRAVKFVSQARRRWESGVRKYADVWNWIDYLFRGNSLRSGGRDVHVPELLKAHRSLLPRIVEAFLGNGQDWFAAAGVDSEDKSREAAITAYLEGELERNRFREKLVAGISSMLKYSIICFKVAYERKTRRQPYHWVEEKLGKDGRVEETHYREFRDIVHWAGNKIHLVKPTRLIVDTRRWDIDELDYIGDFGWFPIDEILKQGHLYKNLDKMRDKSRNLNRGEIDIPIGRDTGVNDYDQDAEQERTQLQGGRSRTELTELWGWFDFNTEEGGVPDMREAVITVADESVCLRLMENPHDDKHRPYAIGRFSDNGFQFYDVGLYAPALRIQDEIDHFRGSLQEAADNTIAPRTFISGRGADLPSSLLDSPVGAVFRDVGNVTFQPTPNLSQSAPLIDGILRRDMEEILGVPRIWQGAESAPGQDSTATEIRRKIEEGNRRLLGLIYSVDACCVRMLQIMHANTQQFMTTKTKFRLHSKRYAKVLGGNQYEIKPSELMHSVDFYIYGVKRIATYGLRGTNMMTWLQVMMPLIEKNPGVVNEAEALRESWRGMMGETSDENVINTVTSFDALEDQHSENLRLMRGIRVAVDPRDDDEQHIRQMFEEGVIAAVQKKGARKDAADAVQEHLALHAEQMRRKQAQQRAMEQEQRRLGAGQEQEQQEGPDAGATERGARQTNGPGLPSQTAKMGRQSPVEQSRNGTA